METYLCKHTNLKKGGTCPHFLVKNGIKLECKDCRYSKLESSPNIVIEGIIEF